MKSNRLFAFGLVTSLFFFWGFIHNLDPILIPHLRNVFSLSHFQASLVDSAIFIAYFVMAIPAGLIMKKKGYKSGILIGLLFFAIGCFLFVPAANALNYAFFLGALFVVACGLTILETAANPYVTILGDPKTGAQRLNFAQSFNGLAAFLAPIIGGKLILSDTSKTPEQIVSLTEQTRQSYLLSEAATVKMPYLILGILILVVAVIFYFTKLPDITDSEEKDSDGFFHALRHRNVRMAVLAQFFYVGAQVCILSFLVLFATEVAGVSAGKAATYSGFAGLAFLLGRFIGTVLMRYVKPPILMAVFALAASVLTIYVIIGSGVSTLYALIGISFCMSIMYPTIFAMGIQGLGADTKAASSLIVMSIVGGAVLPPILGQISDMTHHFQYGYIVPLVSFIVVLVFAISNKNVDLKGTEQLKGGH
ncbi:MULTISPECIES: L-fucose:H+ symporter permease [Chitinophagaceae]